MNDCKLEHVTSCDYQQLTDRIRELEAELKKLVEDTRSNDWVTYLSTGDSFAYQAGYKDGIRDAGKEDDAASNSMVRSGRAVRGSRS